MKEQHITTIRTIAHVLCILEHSTAKPELQMVFYMTAVMITGPQVIWKKNPKKQQPKNTIKPSTSTGIRSYWRRGQRKSSITGL